MRETDSQSNSLTDKQQRILNYIKDIKTEKTYITSKKIGRDLGLSAKEVGSNMPFIIDKGEIEITKWGYSTGTTWKIGSTSG